MKRYIFVAHSGGRLTWHRRHESIQQTEFVTWSAWPIDYPREAEPIWLCDRVQLLVAHLLIVPPLTLLSFYLILWKPRKRVKSDA